MNILDGTIRVKGSDASGYAVIVSPYPGESEYTLLATTKTKSTANNIAMAFKTIKAAIHAYEALDAILCNKGEVCEKTGEKTETKNQKISASDRRARAHDIANAGLAAERAARDFIYRLHNTAINKAMAPRPARGNVNKWRSDCMAWDAVASFVEKHWKEEDKRFTDVIYGE